MASVIIHDAGDLGETGPMRGSGSDWRPQWEGDRHIKQRKLGYRVYVVGIGDSIKVKGYGGRIGEKSGDRREEGREAEVACLFRRGPPHYIQAEQGMHPKRIGSPSQYMQ